MQISSENFYTRHARRYSEVVDEYLESGYQNPSHPQLANDQDILERLKSLVPGPKGLDAGCGAGARDVHLLCSQGFDVYGVDAVPENVKVASEQHPEIADRLQVADLTEPLPFSDGTFDFAMCNSVIQHITPRLAKDVTLRELVRVLRPGGVLQLMFKNGHGLETVFDRDYGVERSFQLYDERDLLTILEGYECNVVKPATEGDLGGFMYLTDFKPMRYCLFHVIKTAATSRDDT